MRAMMNKQLERHMGGSSQSGSQVSHDEPDGDETQSASQLPPHVFVHSHSKGVTVHIHHHNGKHEKHEHSHGDVDGIAQHIHDHYGTGEPSDQGEAPALGEEGSEY